MQSYPPCDPNVADDTFDDETTRARVRRFEERLKQRMRPKPIPYEGVPPEELPCDRWQDSTDSALGRGPGELGCWGRSANYYLGSRKAHRSVTMQRLQHLLKERRHEEFRDELARAEIAGEVSEFSALNYQAILAVVEGSEFAIDYLEMAEAVASSPYELAVIAENRAAYDLLQGNPVAAAKHCLATLDHVYQTEGLWNNLLIALYRLGEMETFDATLRSFAQLNDECMTRLVELLSSEPDLYDVRARPAFSELLHKRVAGTSRLTVSLDAATMHSS